MAYGVEKNDCIMAAILCGSLFLLVVTLSCIVAYYKLKVAGVI